MPERPLDPREAYDKFVATRGGLLRRQVELEAEKEEAVRDNNSAVIPRIITEQRSIRESLGFVESQIELYRGISAEKK